MTIHKDDNGNYPSFAWPGGYPIYYLMGDCECLCPDCANDPTNPIHEDKSEEDQHGEWRIVASDINWEDSQMFCVHCGKQIESAYGAE